MDQGAPPLLHNPADGEEPDFNNPPLRRMRSSMVNRRRMAEMQEREVCEKYATKAKHELFSSMW